MKMFTTLKRKLASEVYAVDTACLVSQLTDKMGSSDHTG
jgi:hypothetical protein